MRTKLYLLSALLIFACASLASAHPLGNFSVNQFSRVEVEKSQVKIRAVLDIAEIPTFQESQTIDVNKDGALSDEELNTFADEITPDFVANLQLSVDNQPIALRSIKKNITLPTGAGNLPTLRIEWNLIGDLPNADKTAVQRVTFENKNNAERVGWNEIVVESVSGINIFDSTAFGSGVTNELKSYPNETLNAPLSERKAEFSFTSAPLFPMQNLCKTATESLPRQLKEINSPN
jgi:hypothetical protein